MNAVMKRVGWHGLGGFAAWACLPCLNAAAAATTTTNVTCPPSVATTQSLVAGRETTGWTSWVESPEATHRLTRVEFYESRSGGREFLAPDNAAGPAVETKRWAFSGKSEIWIVCRYFGTKVALTQSLPSDIKSCEVKHGKALLSSGPAVTCR